MDWFNNRRLLEPIGYVPPVEAEASYYATLDDMPLAAWHSNQHASGTPGAVQLGAVEGLVAAGPERLRADDVQTRRLWAEKMLARAEKGGPEGDYRRHWLLKALLEDYFALRGQWYLGPKRSLFLLKRERPQAFAVFCKALDPSASIADIRAAVAMVIGVEDPSRPAAQ